RDPDDRKRQQELQAQVRRLDQQIAAHLAGKDPLGAGRAGFQELTRQRSAAVAGLFELDAKGSLGLVYDVGRSQRQLPADAAPGAWIDRQGDPGAADPDGEHWALLVKKGGPPVAVKLPGSGEQGAWTRDDDELPRRARRAWAGAARAGATAEPPARAPDPGALARRLYAQRLAPLERHLDGVKRLVVLPAGRMAGVPVEALTDRYTVRYAPSAPASTRP